MQRRMCSMFIATAVLTSSVALIGCPQLPAGARLGLWGTLEVTGNIYPAYPLLAQSGFRYTPIGAESMWTLTDTSDWQWISQGTSGYYANDNIPPSKVTWNVGTWSKTPGAFTGAFSVTKTATDWISSPNGPNMRCAFQNQGEAPFVLEPYYQNCYSYVHVIKPGGASVKCAQRDSVSSGLQYRIFLQLYDSSGTPSTLNWSHCRIKEFTVDDGEPGTDFNDGCGVGKPEWGGSAPPQGGNMYGDVMAFGIDEQHNPSIVNPWYSCEVSFLTKWKISSDNSHWYDIESVRYVYTFFNHNGTPQMDMTRKGTSVTDMPEC